MGDGRALENPILRDRAEPKRLLLLTSARVNRLQEQVLSRLEVPLTSRQHRVLARVHEGHNSPTALARLARRSLPTLSESIEGLVRRGLLTRTESPADRRAVILALTAEGEEALKLAEEKLDQLAEALLAVVPAGGSDKLTRHLGALFDRAEFFLDHDIE